MKKRRKTFILLILILLLVPLLLFSVFLITLYHHPTLSKNLLEQAIASATGLTPRIEDLSYSLRPLRVDARGIHLQSKEEGEFTLAIPELALRASLDGPFGDKSLRIDNLQVRGPFLRLHPREPVDPDPHPEREPSLFSRILRSLMDVLLFRRVDVATLRASDGRAEVEIDHLPFALEGIEVEIASDSLAGYSVAAGFAAHMNTAPRAMKVDVRMRAQGSYDKARVSFPMWRIDVGDFMEFEGSLHWERDRRDIRMTVERGLIRPEAPVRMLRQGGIDLPFELTGPPLFVSGEITGASPGEGRRWWCDVKAEFAGNRFSATPEGMSLHLPLSGTVHASGVYPDLTSALSAETRGASFQGKGFHLEGVDASISAAGQYPSYSLKKLDVELKQDPFFKNGEKALLRSVRIADGKGSIHVEEKRLEVEQGVLLSPLLGEMNFSLSARPEAVRLHMAGEGPRMVRWPQEFGIIPVDWEISGTGKLGISASLSGEGPLTVNTSFTLSQFGFQEPTMTYTAEGIGLHADMAGTLDLEAGTWTTESSLVSEEGEILLDRHYFDLGKQRLHVFLHGDFHTETGLIQVKRLDAGLKELLTLSLKGTVDTADAHPKIRLTLFLPETDIADLFEHFIRIPYQTESPFLGDVDLSGALSADLELEASGKGKALVGTCRWTDGQVKSAKEGLFFQGIDLSLPIWHAEAGLGKPHPSPEGRITIDAFRVPLLPEQTLDLPLAAGENLLTVSAPFTLQAPGGSITLGPLTMEDWSGGTPRILTRAVFHGVDAGPLLSEIWGRPISSRIDGKLDPVRIEGGELRTEGGLHVELFGGDVLIEEIRFSGFGSSGPDIRLSARLEDIHLAEMTQDTSFGKIEGVLMGEIKGLQVAYGQPQQFELFLETVRKKGVPQRISLRAVENISRLGGGGSPFMGMAGVFASLFKEFPYQKMGVRAHLENDVFRINGTIQENGQEYLVKRGTLSGVNVINQNPDNRISFKDMLKRLQRITSDGGGPVVR